MIRTPLTASSRRRGFALLITIVLVAFLVLILVGLATFTRVETQVAANAEDLGKARQSALTGLNIAIGKLQRHAGPDASVTARSDFKNAGLLITNNPHITGVWDTTAAGNNPAAWLVSGTEDDPLDDNDVEDPADPVSAPYGTTNGKSWVFLAYDGAVGNANAADRIRVVKRPIQVPRASVPGFGSAGADVTIGNYAYWVGDEGTKASIGAAPPDLSSLNYNNTAANGDNWAGVNATELKERLNQFSQPYHRLDQIFGVLTYPAAAANLRKVVTLEQLRFVVPTTQYNTFLQSFHDITPLTRGVLARTNAGNGPGNRLRVDLSATSVAGGNSATNAYLLQRPSGTSGLVATHSLVGRSPVAGYWVGPVLSEAGIYFGMSASRDLTFQINAELWNPYASSLDIPANTLGVRVRIVNDLVFTAETSAGAPPTTQSHTFTVSGGTEFTRNFSAQTLDPGEITFFQSNSTGTFSSGSGSMADSGVSAVPAMASDPTKFGVPDSNDSIVIELFESATNTVLQRFFVPNIGGGPASAAVDDVNAGYGYELRTDLRVWTDNKLDLALGLGNARDPRALEFKVDPTDPSDSPFEPLGAGNWKAEATSNNGTESIANGSPFVKGNPAIILFDLPRQEVTSLAQLRHMISAKPYGMTAGSPLWDTSFMSTVPMSGAWDYQTQARPNRYLEVYEPPQAPDGEFDTPANKLASLRDPARSARFQLIRGAFNINSTSVKAWSTVLGASLQNWDTEANGPTDITGAFFRTPHGAQSLGVANLVPTASLSDATTLTAVGRRLTAAEIDRLAQEIVDALKANPLNRPFYSLSEFASSNVLTTAISAAGINNTLNAENRFTAGAVTPGDILAAIAPFMSARSDTFKVRAYGDTQNPVTGEVTGRVWCEAIVQRVPDLCRAPNHETGSDDAAIAPVDTVVEGDPTKFIFGRKFQIVSFRWLNSDDI